MTFIIGRILGICRCGKSQEVWKKLARAGCDISATTPPLSRALSPGKEPQALILCDCCGGKIQALRETSGMERLPLILLCHEKGKPMQIANFFGAGADDCLPADVEVNILAARLRGLLTLALNHSFFSAGELSLDASSGIVFLRGKRLQLSPSLYRLLYIFMKAKGADISREEILETLYSQNLEVYPAAADKMVERLRRALGSEAKRLRSVYGIGYRFE